MKSLGSRSSRLELLNRLIGKKKAPEPKVYKKRTTRLVVDVEDINVGEVELRFTLSLNGGLTTFTKKQCGNSVCTTSVVDGWSTLAYINSVEEGNDETDDFDLLEPFITKQPTVYAKDLLDWYIYEYLGTEVTMSEDGKIAKGKLVMIERISLTDHVLPCLIYKIEKIEE